MKDETRKKCKVRKRVICYYCKRGKESISHDVSEKEKISTNTSNNDERLLESENEIEEVQEGNESTIEERCEESDVLIVKPDAMRMR
eukprot:13992542-Ditylum_brightwellii.AAC.1